MLLYGCTLNKIGELKYTSISTQFPVKTTGLQDVWKTFVTSNGVYFISTKKIFIWHDSKLSVIETNLHSRYAFEVNEQIYVINKGIGISQIQDTNLVMLPNIEALGEHQRYINIVEYSENELLIIDSQAGMNIYNLKNNSLRKFNIDPQILEYLDINNAYNCVKIDSNNFAVQNQREGVVIFNKKGELINVFNQARGLPTNTLLQIFVDKDKNLWLGANEIFKIDISSPIVFFDKNQKLDCFPIDITVFNNRLFVAAMEGVYLLEDYFLTLSDDNHSFTKFPHIGFSWKFFENDNSIYVAGLDYIYEIIDNISNVILNTKRLSYTFSINQINKFPDYYFFGLYDGLGVAKLNTETSKLINFHTFDEISGNIATIQPDSEENLWLSTDNSGIYYIRFTGDSVTNYTEKNLSDSLIKFEHNSYWGKLFTTASLVVTNLFDLGNNQYIISSEECGFLNVKEDTISWNVAPFKRIPTFNFIIPYPDYLFFTTAKGIYIYDRNKYKDYEKEYNTLISKVAIGKDSIIFNGNFFDIRKDSTIEIKLEQTKQFIPTLEYSENSITIEFSATFFEEESKTEYSYYIKGFDADWSEFNTETKAVYTNLPEGNYIFKAKARNIFDNISTIAEYKFQVKPPWYRTWWAYTSYVIFLILLILIIVKLSLRRVVKAKIKLEGIVKERTTEIFQQKEEIQAQADSLQTAYNEIDNKNKSLSKAHSNIRASINYAKRIQQAMLSSQNILNECFPKNFIINKPKDIVSGDFYYFKQIDNYFILAVADCTGHSVPGGFMTMLGLAFIDDIVKRTEIMDSASVLNTLRDKIINSLKQDNKTKEIYDGMDIAFCAIDKNNLTLSYAGAYRPLYIIRDDEGGEGKEDVRKEEGEIRKEKTTTNSLHPNSLTNSLSIIKADKMPIGTHIKMNDFTNNNIQLQKNDLIYLFSDGFVDQFGGENNQKFSTKQFNKLLVSIYAKPLNEQKQILEQNFNDWKGEKKQLDDVLVVGVKI